MIFKVSPTMLESMACPRRVEYSHVLKRVKAEEGDARRFGKHLHSALSLHHKLGEYGLSTEVITQRVNDLLEELWKKNPTDEMGFRTLNWASELYSRYTAHYKDHEILRWKEPKPCKECEGLGYSLIEGPVTHPDNPLPTIVQGPPCDWCNGTGFTSLMSEVSFALPLCTIGSVEVILHGIIDLVLLLNGLVFVLDYKSTSMLGQGYWDALQASPQMKAYLWAANQLLGLPIKGYVVRALRTKQPPQYILDGGDNAKSREWWRESLGEMRFDLGPGELEEWHRNTVVRLTNFLKMGEAGFYPQEKSLCVGKYGKCDYYEVCNTWPESDRASMLANDTFKDKESPLEEKVMEETTI